MKGVKPASSRADTSSPTGGSESWVGIRFWSQRPHAQSTGRPSTTPGKLSGKLWTHLSRVTDGKRIYWVSIPNLTNQTGKLLSGLWGRPSAEQGTESFQEAAFLSGAAAKAKGPRRDSDNSYWETGPGRSHVTGTEPTQTETDVQKGQAGWGGGHFWPGAAFTVLEVKTTKSVFFHKDSHMPVS